MAESADFAISTLHSDPNSKKLSKKSDFEKISWASIYPSQVIEVHFCVKNSYFLFSSN